MVRCNICTCNVVEAGNHTLREKKKLFVYHRSFEFCCHLNHFHMLELMNLRRHLVN
jgi:hypothetical protein